MEQYLGTIVFAKALNRTLILPPFQYVTYRHRRVHVSTDNFCSDNGDTVYAVMMIMVFLLMVVIVVIVGMGKLIE